ncbi:MAG: porin [Ectothiorhodospiraceae bacterium]|nr:porin [Ectothiorhodospiraceae bacterium]
MKTQHGKPLLIAAILTASLFPVTGQTAQILGDRLEVYGLLHLSLDYAEPDDDVSDSESSVSSNASRFGFRGALPIEGSNLTGIWQIERQVDLSGESAAIGQRQSFVGLRGGFGTLRVGLLDNPYRVAGIRGTLFTGTAADPQAIIGRSSDNAAHLNTREASSINWQGEFSGVRLAAQFGGVGDEESISASIGRAFGWTDLTAAYRSDDNVDHAYRVIAVFTPGAARFGLLFEHMDSDIASFDRQTYGAHAQYTFGTGTSLGVQWLHAAESDVGDAKANHLGLVLSHRLAPQLSVYAAGTTTLNGENAQYAAGGFGHGSPVGGGVGDNSPRIVSAGTIFTF